MDNNFIDVKVTVWHRMHFTDESDMNAALTVLKENGIGAITSKHGFDETEILYESQCDLAVENNNGYATIEVFQSEKLIWDNTQK